MIGRRLGTYEVLERLGAGAMGEVYRARDTKLGRDVAIKVLPHAFVADRERVSRFEREARVLATLNHRNIGAIYEVEDVDGMPALVLELVEGETLAEKLEQTSTLDSRVPRLPIAATLDIAHQIAEALEAAHDKGIIHRDLKPANIKITPAGTVKVLDFGLAKHGSGSAGGAGHAEWDLKSSPTMTLSATAQGTLLGTAAYMSPEQARGQAVDRRTDVWAFGCVLYEMLTGSLPFPGHTISDHIAAILEREPDWSRLPAATPASIRTLLRRCLQKDLSRRLPHIGAARIEIAEAPTSAGGDLNNEHAGISARGSRRLFPWTVAAASVVIGGLALWAPWRETEIPNVVRLTADLGADVSLVTEDATAGGAAAVLSPDGTVLAFIGQASDGRSQLYVRSLSQVQAKPLAGTDLARYPFFSPDGRWIGFFADGKLKKIATTGGAVVPLADVSDARGGTWAEDGTIAFVPGGKGGSNLQQVSSVGGKVETLVTLRQGEITQRWPQFLPGGKSILFTSHTRIGDYNDAELVVQSLPDAARTVLQPHGYYGRYFPSGHLMFARDGALFAAPFDPARAELKGPAVPVVDDLVTRANTGTAQFAASENGTLVYLPKPNEAAPLQLVEKSGMSTPLRDGPTNWDHLRFSPDGRRLAMDISDGSHSDVWICELSSGTLTRFTLDQSSSNPVWTLDGRRLAFASRRDGPVPNIYWQRADGTGEAQRLTESPNTQLPESWHPSGRFLAFMENTSSSDVMILPIGGDESAGWKPGTPTAFANTPAHELTSSFSADGRWIAYAFNEGARFLIHIRPFPGPGGTRVVSTGIGNNPTWSRMRRELFYGTADRHIMALPYSVEGDSFRAGTPVQWSRIRFVNRRGGGFDLHPDGERLAMAKMPDDTERNKVVFVFNFFDELRRIAHPKQ
jgi:serine/threonine-protein kinase